MISSLEYSRNLDDSRVVDAGAVGFFILFNLACRRFEYPVADGPLSLSKSQVVKNNRGTFQGNNSQPDVAARLAPVDAYRVSRRSPAASRYRCTLEFLDMEFNLCSPPNMCNQPCGSHGRCRWPF